MNMKILSFLTFLCILTSACTPNISSSELKETEAGDLELSARIYEYEDDSTATVTAILKTIPDGVGVQLNQGETLKAGMAMEDDSISYSFMSYDDNFLDIGETYEVDLTKPEVGEDYYITYTDVNGVETTALFSSDGVPELITPTEEQEVLVGSVVALTWDSQDLGLIYVEVDYTTTGGGSGWTRLSTSDTGSYDLDLSHSYFDDLAPGETELSIRHDTRYDEMDGFGDANITVSAYSERNIQVVSSSTSASARSLDEVDLTAEEIIDNCQVVCDDDAEKKVYVDDEWHNCCIEN